ncbi:S-adenosyl-L-methionine-dependent methyltransferase [Peniophora sp. CONT]|nr:S-adenosyl-L-methionine-dependent methyltransferase [Peniophora sp. CONT]
MSNSNLTIGEDDQPGASPVSFAQANAQHFDCEAHRYEHHAGTRELVRRVARAMQKEYSFDEESTTVLDYACGTGMLSRALSPHARSIVGVDISAASVAEYNLRVANQGLGPEDMRAVVGPPTGAPAALDSAQFDVVVCSMAYHHFSLPGEITALLAHLLKPGGVLLVVDLMTRVKDNSVRTEREEIFSLAHQHLVPHRYGFSCEEMRAMFGEAGLEDFKFKTAFCGFKPIIRKPEAVYDSNRRADGAELRDVSFFLARGSKPMVRRPIPGDHVTA